jgi:hypothetical protein
LKIISFTALGIISLCGFLLTLLPASIFFSLLPQDIRTSSDLLIGHPNGTIWSGKTTLEFRNFPASSLQWRFSGISISGLKPSASYHLIMAGAHHEIQARLNISELQLSLDQLQGFIHSKGINQLSAEYGHQFSGELLVQDGSLTTDFGCLQALTGQLDWDGGNIVLNVSEPPLNLQLPAMTGILDSKGCNASLSLKQQTDKLMVIYLKPSGWVEAEVYQKMLRLAGLAQQKTVNDESKPVLLFEEKIL